MISCSLSRSEGIPCHVMLKTDKDVRVSLFARSGVHSQMSRTKRRFFRALTKNHAAPFWKTPTQQRLNQRHTTCQSLTAFSFFGLWLPVVRGENPPFKHNQANAGLKIRKQKRKMAVRQKGRRDDGMRLGGDAGGHVPLFLRVPRAADGM